MNAAVQNDELVAHLINNLTSFSLLLCTSIKHTCSYASISNFTLHVLEDSGWYKVNYAVAESIHNYEPLWGKGEN